MKVKIEGLDELNALFKKMTKLANKAIEKEIKIVGLDLQGKSQELAPVDLGDLQGSAFTEVSGLDATVGFTEPYALRQHEEMGYRHRSPGQSKYLEQPYKENVPRYVKMIGDAVEKAVDKKGGI
jgi:hypothetical protein